jgi:hypothetical protein
MYLPPKPQVYLPYSTQVHNMEPLLTALRAEPSSPVFLHLFSNSGAQSASTLLRAYRDTSPSSKETLPVKGVLLDSTPSTGKYSSAYAGLSYELIRFPLLLRLLGVVFVHGLISTVWLYALLTGQPNVLTKANEDLNDPFLTPKDAPRAYLYSREDKLVRSEDVEAHAEAAEKRGWRVKRVSFEGTDHCRHAKGKGEGTYWRVVQDVVCV